jgi:hypothetical protein
MVERLSTAKNQLKTKMIMKRQGKKNPKDTEEAQDLPGYPPYPPEEDIVRNGTRVEGDIGDDGFGERSSGIAKAVRQNTSSPETTPGAEPASGEFDVTDEDLEALGPVDLSLDLGEDEQLKQRTNPVDFAGEDLDVPGASDDDSQEAIGSEDEENNGYSLGGDAHSDLEEGRQ